MTWLLRKVMPTLKLATFCEKVIVDVNGVPSAIGLFSQLNVAVPPATIFPENAIAPKEWAMLFIWECTLEEVGREFSQLFKATTADGKSFGAQSTIKFTPQRDRLRQNVVANSQAVPIGRAGKVTITTHLELDEQIVVSPMEFGFDVVLVKAV